MDFESVEQTAARLSVTTRTVQKWAKAGKIPGACQMGRTWLIPAGFAGLDKAERIPAEKPGPPSCHFCAPTLINAVFEPGRCLEYIEALPSGVWRDVAAAQYHYYRAEVEQAVLLSEPYLDHEDLLAALSSSVVYSFANLGLGKIHLFRIGREHMEKHILMSLRRSEDPQRRAYAVFITNMVHVLLHIPCPPIPPLESVARYLPMGARLYTGYLMAHEAYLEKDYSRALGILELAQCLCSETYVIPTIYLHLMASVVLMNLRRTTEAKTQFELAWNLAQADGMIGVFHEHMGMMQGLLEVHLKKQHPGEYERVIRGAAVFVDSWRKVHNEGANRNVSHHLTAMENAVASLFQRGWAVKEISAYMDISPRMVRHHISVVYEKLGITHREELAEYLVL